jgi:outer membrane lipoprotein-sorting protein
MKKVLSILFISVLSLGSAVAQDVDEILKNYFETIGGKDNWEKMESMVLTGKLTMRDMELPITVYSQRPNLQCMEISAMGKTVIEAYDGTSAWTINPFQGGEAAQKGTQEQSDAAAKELFENDFINYKEKGSTVKLTGTQNIEGTDCYMVLLTEKNGDESIYFFDQENYVPIMIESAITYGPMKGKLEQEFYSDYMEVGDVIVAHFRESKVDGNTEMKMVFESFEFNVAIDKSKYEMPK